ncbi:MAG: SPOR domain-containing protein [Candidatus Cloacimonetes bacterium]|nr:SPOR domain-containing protein [Candidatus Cloacimonadota bacterium]
MKNVLSFIVIIIAVGTLIIVSVFIIGTIVHNIKINSDYQIAQQPVIEEESIDDEIKDKNSIDLTEVSGTEQIKPEYQEGIDKEKNKIKLNRKYEVQLFLGNDYTKVEKIKTELKLEGYECDIHTLSTSKSTFYRLRLSGLYSKLEGNRLGNEIVTSSPNISSFWLDEIKDGKNVDEIEATVTQTPKTTKIISPSSNDDFEIQILASTERNFVEDKKKILEKAGYKTKITTTVKNGKTFYRLRLVDSCSRANAIKIGDKLKKDVHFISDYWVVSKSDISVSVPQITKEESIAKDESLTETIQYSVKPKDEFKDKKEQITMICNTNNINIHIGPGTYYAVDPIGKLMKGVTIFVVYEKNNWIKFTITPNDESWSGWVDKKYLK